MDIGGQLANALNDLGFSIDHELGNNRLRYPEFCSEVKLNA